MAAWPGEGVCGGLEPKVVLVVRALPHLDHSHLQLKYFCMDVLQPMGNIMDFVKAFTDNTPFK